MLYIHIVHKGGTQQEQKQTDSGLHSSCFGARYLCVQLNVQQQRLQHLDESVQERLRILDDKTKGKRAVSFKAARTNHITLGGDSTLVFDHVYEDTHGAYSASTGVFAAPRKGRYMLSTTVLSQPGKYVPACIAKNGRCLMVFHTGESRKWNSGSLTITEYLDKGERVEIKMVHGQSGHVWGDTWTTFNGFWLSD